MVVPVDSLTIETSSIIFDNFIVYMFENTADFCEIYT